MKRKSFILLLLLSPLFVLAQQKRLVLVEEFTNTGCGPCASWSPELDSCINYRLGDCIAIKYHSSFPNSSDEFFLYDKDTQSKKVEFYQVTGVPATFIDGNELFNRGFATLHDAISWSLEQPVKTDVSVSMQLGTDHVVKASVTVKPVADLSNPNLRLFVAVVEEHIESAVPFPNGEHELNYTMRKMLTGGAGHDLGPMLSAAQTYSYEGSWTADFCDNEKELGVVAFVQDITTREVLGTAYVGPQPENENEISLLSLSDTPDLICLPDYYGKVIFRNNGAGTISSAILNVRVNGSLKQYPWTGSLNYLERDTLVFSDFSDFMLVTTGKNEVEVWFSDINGTTAKSNRITDAFVNSVQAVYSVQLKIYTDKKPEETTWKVINSAGDIVQQGGPYTEARKFYTETLNLTADDCYQIEFLDAGGDGIKGANGNGYYQLIQIDAAGKTKRLTQGDYDGAVFDLFFRLEGTPAQRPLVVFEEFTNTGCAPCADFSPAFNDLIYRRMGEMVPITYHYNFPSSKDPFYLANPVDVEKRASFYGVTGVPSLAVMGVHAGSYGYEDFLDTYIDAFEKTKEKVRLYTDAQLSDDGELKVRTGVLPLDIAEKANLRLFVVAVEERVEWDHSAENGERAWNYVMRKMLPSADGEPLPASLANATTPYYCEYTWPVTGYEDMTQLGLVSFVQDMDTKELIGTSYTPLPTGSPRAAKILQVLDVPDRICTPSYTAHFVVRNTGRENLTRALLNVSINGQVQSTPWTGMLRPLQIDTLQTPLFTDFQLSNDKTNEVQLWLSGLNGSQEESPRQVLTLNNAYSASNAVRLTIMTDQKPEEISWALFNSADDVVEQGGPYTEARKKMVHDLQLTCDDCYALVFTDAGGDGITGTHGRGYFMLHEVGTDGKTRLLVQGDYTGSSHQVYFSLHNATAAAVPSVAADAAGSQQDAPIYDLQGRRVAQPRQGIFIQDKQKIIINNK